LNLFTGFPVQAGVLAFPAFRPFQIQTKDFIPVSPPIIDYRQTFFLFKFFVLVFSLYFWRKADLQA